MTNLKPCPFCGDEDAYSSSINGAVFCEGCGAQGPWSPFTSVDWNTRAPTPIKPLLWEHFDAWTYWAETIVGRYELACSSVNDLWYLKIGNRTVEGEINSAEDGMALAQSDFDSLVRGVMG